MGWIRAHTRHCTWLALFALALQLVLSFGHMHADEFIVGKTGITVAQTDHGPGAADDDGIGHAGCAICATLHLVTTSLLPLPPQLALPPPDAFIWVALDTRETLLSPHRPFQARAPPLA